MSLLSQVLTSAEEVELEQIKTKAPEIAKAASKCKDEILTYLDNVHVKFLERPRKNKLLSNKLATLQKEIEELTNSLDHILKKNVSKAKSDLELHVESLTKAKVEHELVGGIYKISEELYEIKQLRSSGPYLACVMKIVEAESLVEEFPSSEKLEVLEELSSSIEKEKNFLLVEMAKIVKDNMVFKVETNKSVLKISNEDTLANVIAALHYYQPHIAALDDLPKFLWGHIFVPVVDYVTEVKTSVDEDFTILEVLVVDEHKKSSYAEVFANIKMILNFLSTNCDIALNDGITVLGYVGRDIRDNLSEIIIKHCLQDTIPSTLKELEKYSVVVEATEDLEKMLLKTNIFAEDTTSIVAYTKNIDTLFIKKKCQNYLTQAQTLMKKDLHDLVEVGVEDPKKSLESTPDFPRCSISTSVLELVRLMETILTEASSSSKMCAGHLFATVENICRIYCKFVPEYHEKLLRTIPQQIAVFYNNCVYISHNLTEWTLTILKGLQAVGLEKAAFTDVVGQLEEVSGNMFTNYETEQIKQIEEIMKKAGLQQQTLNNVESSTEKCIRQCLRQQELLKTVWHKVLPYTLYNKTLGTILNALCSYVVGTVTKCEDISASAAEQLVELFKMVQTRGPKLFTDPKEVALFVSSWYRLNELIFVLNANLLDINDRWADGKGPLALQFKPEELKQLIRALFQNTERRAVLLAKIHD